MIKKLGIEDFEEIFSIMEQSFPVDEYRDKQGQRRIFDENNYSVYGYFENQKIFRNYTRPSKALFSLENFLVLATVALSFVCDKYCPIMD